MLAWGENLNAHFKNSFKAERWSSYLLMFILLPVLKLISQTKKIKWKFLFFPVTSQCRSSRRKVANDLQRHLENTAALSCESGEANIEVEREQSNRISHRDVCQGTWTTADMRCPHGKHILDSRANTVQYLTTLFVVYYSPDFMSSAAIIIIIVFKYLQ